MLKSILQVITMMCITISIFTGCKSPSEKVESAVENVVEADEALEKANDEYKADMETYRAETAAKIVENEKMITDFRARVELEKKSARADYNEKIDKLNQKNSDLKMKLDGYNADGKEKWETFKTEFNRDMDELGQAFNDLTIKNNK